MHKEKRKSKISCLVLTALFGGIELLFIGQLYKSTEFPNNLIIQVIPTQITFREFFFHMQTLLPYLLLTIIAIFDIYSYKVYEHEVQDSEDVVYSKCILKQETLIKDCIKLI